MQRDVRQSFAFTLKAQDGRARARRNRDAARGHPHACLHAGRHRAPRSRPCCRRRCAPTGADIILANTYHLMLRPGAERIAKLGGLAPLHGLGRADPHRFRRLSGHVAVEAPPHRGARRDLPVAYRRRHASAHARARHRGAMPARRRHPDGARRMHAVSGDARRGQVLDGAVDALGRALEAGVSNAGRAGPGVVRHRAGQHLSRPARAERRSSAGHRLRRLCRSAGLRSAKGRRPCSTPSR